jgi:hypothetical protein
MAGDGAYPRTVRWTVGGRGGVGPLVTSLNKSPVRSRDIGPLVNWQLIGRRPLCIGQLPTYIGMCTTDACGTSLLVE